LAAARSVGWGEVVTYGRLAALAGRPRAAPGAGGLCAPKPLSTSGTLHTRVSGGGHFLRAEPLVARRPLPPGRRGRQGRAVRARGVRLGREHPEAPFAGARADPPVSTAALVADARAELAAVAPERRCDRLAEISALFHTAGTVHLLGRGELRFQLDLAESAVARRAFPILRALRVDSAIR